MEQLNVKILSGLEIKSIVEIISAQTIHLLPTDTMGCKIAVYSMERALNQRFPNVNTISYQLDQVSIDVYNSQRSNWRTLLDRLVLFIPMMDNEFPLVGSVVDSYCKWMEEVNLIGSTG